MTKEEALEILDTIPTISEQVDALEMAIKALEQEPCVDCISREAVKDILHKRGQKAVITFEHFEELVNKLPSVTPKAEIEKQEPAEWIVDTDDSRRWDRVRFYCSACNSWNTYGKSKYCPNCGRRMQSEDR